MAGEQLQAGLTLDLGDLTARLTTVEARNKVIAAATEQSVARIKTAEGKVSSLDNSIHKVERKLSNVAKGLLKQGIGIGIANAFTDSDKVGFFGGLTGTAISAALFGGPHAAATATLFFLIHKIGTLFQETKFKLDKVIERQYELNRAIATDKKEREEKEREFIEKFTDQMKERPRLEKEAARAVFNEVRAHFQEEFYQTMLALGQEGIK